MIVTPAWIALLALGASATDVAQQPSDTASTPSASATDAKQQKADGMDIRVFWKDGFRMETADKQFSMRISGRFQNDWAWFSGDEDDFIADGIGELNDGTEIRRAYLGVDGKLFGDYEYKLEWDFAKSANDFADAYLATNTGIGNARVGHFKQPMGLEELTSDVNTTFMERSLSGGFKLGRDVGAQLSDTVGGETVTWAVGAFRDTNGNGLSGDGATTSDTSDDEYAFTGRVAASPWYADDGKKVLHFGVSASHRNPTTNGATFSSKPESNLAPNFVTTGAIADADEYDQIGLEFATVLGPVSVQAEYMQAMIDGTSAGGDDPDLSGYYAFVSYFITGEHRPYKRQGAVFDRVKPAHNFTKKDGGCGAWEVGLRYTHLDFDDAVATEAGMTDVTAGVNWYLTPFVKMQFNAIRATAETGSGDDDATIFQVRFQFDF